MTDVTAVPEDPARDPNFREPQIDQLRSQKDEDLERYRKDIEKRFRQINDEFDQSMILQWNDKAAIACRRFVIIKCGFFDDSEATYATLTFYNLKFALHLFNIFF